uniref:UPAR/Ly6 domain-containing protein n=1 Tax=Leptobrachium leishanense TaxID=445787 RepID=A0A8C5RBI7_9ANUR
MKLMLWCGLFSAILCLTNGFQCYRYKGPVDHVLEKQEAKQCESTHQSCKSSLLMSDDLNMRVLVKSCSKEHDDACNKTHTSSGKGFKVTEIMMCCEGDLCNKDLLPVSDKESEKWGMDCLACNGQPMACAGNGLPTLHCDSPVNQCIQVSITTALGQEVHQTLMKGCSNSSTCPGLSAFSNGQNPVSYASSSQCCTSSHCNSGHFTDTDPGAENGLECYSCSSPSDAGKMKCRGEMTRCMDLMGSSNHDVVMSGCATEAFCQGQYPKFSIPGWSSTTCCTTSLCNHNSNATPPAP